MFSTNRRTSSRLQANGYYGLDGKRVINYNSFCPRRTAPAYRDRRLCYTDPGLSCSEPRLSYSSRRLCYTDPGLFYRDPELTITDPGSLCKEPRTSYSDAPLPNSRKAHSILVRICAAVIFFLVFYNVFQGWTTFNEEETIQPEPLNPNVEELIQSMPVSEDNIAHDDPIKTLLAMKQDSPLQSYDARVHLSRSTVTYGRNGFFEAVINWMLPKHGLVLEPKSELVPYICWPFRAPGHMHIELVNPVHITDVTLGHITKSQTPNGELTSAPRLFSVYGMENLDDKETFLGQFEYDINGSSFQTFPITSTDTFKHVRLNVESNWGNEEYTCLYNFGVHGTPAEL